MAFYSALFGWEFSPHFSEAEPNQCWTIHMAGDVGGTLIEEKTPLMPGGSMIYIHVDHIENVLRRVVELGGAISQGRSAIGGKTGFMARILDPDGNRIGVWQP
jgi:predicted enzyme related to lactoylglutathione lyase